MSPLSSPLLRLPLLGSALLAGCGASYQHIYEGDVRFEHCYRLDADASVQSQQRLACWTDWSQGHTLGQTLDRVAYARRRQTALQSGQSDLAGPTLVTGRPSAVASQTLALRTSAPAPTAVNAATTTTTGTPAATARTAPTAATASGTSARNSLVSAPTASAPAGPARELSSHQLCSHDCGVTFTDCVSLCDGQTCAQRCGNQVKVCLDLCL